MQEWHKWRKDNPKEVPRLERAKLGSAFLEGVDLSNGYLRGIYLAGAHMAGANLERACLSGADLNGAFLQESCLSDANLEGAHMLQAMLDKAWLEDTHLQKARLNGARLRGACLRGAHVEGALVKSAVVDGETLLWDLSVDNGTDFSGVALANARVQPGLRPRLEYNIRRLAWHRWYATHRFLALPAWLFWWVSDYGRSTWRIIFSFLALAFAFALAYFVCPHLVENLAAPSVSWPVRLVRSVYFSVVTMTTLGFGDMYAAAHSIPGYVLLMLHVVLGYVLLAALVTRVAILFTSAPET